MNTEHQDAFRSSLMTRLLCLWAIKWVVLFFLNPQDIKSMLISGCINLLLETPLIALCGWRRAGIAMLPRWLIGTIAAVYCSIAYVMTFSIRQPTTAEDFWISVSWAFGFIGIWYFIGIVALKRNST